MVKFLASYVRTHVVLVEVACGFHIDAWMVEPPSTLARTACVSKFTGTDPNVKTHGMVISNFNS